MITEHPLVVFALTAPVSTGRETDLLKRDVVIAVIQHSQDWWCDSPLIGSYTAEL